MSRNYNIIHGHDGAADDQMALLLLLTKHKLLATVLTPADSHLDPAEEMCKKILVGTDNIDIPLIVNNVSIMNPFPDQWKDESYDVNKLIDIDISNCNIESRDIHYLIDLILTSDKPIIYVETGTLTTLAQCLSINPLIEDKIEKLIWTGGSFGENGTYLPEGCDGSQTYNSYSDPISAKVVFDTNIDIVLLTREATDKALLSKVFYEQLPDTRYGNIYKNVYAFYIDMSFYRLWDVLTVSYIDIPEIFERGKYECQVKLITEGKSQGKTEICSNGRKVHVICDIDLDLFHSYVIKQLS